MINLILSFLRLRSLITLGIVYSLFSAATHSNFSLKIPSFSDASIENLNKAINQELEYLYKDFYE